MTQNYPHLQFRQHWRATSKTVYELGQCDALVMAIRNFPLLPEYHQQLMNVSLTKGAQATTAIEGNTLSQEEIDLIRRGGSLQPSKRYQATEVRNILEAYNNLLDELADEDHDELIRPELLLRFHKMIGKDLGDHFDAVPGQFRSDARRVGPYLAPHATDIRELLQQLCDWVRVEFHYQHGQTFTDSVVQAIVIHVYIEWIHPFADGNGRTGRLAEFYVLLRAGLPDIASHILSNFYNETRPEYYRKIQEAYLQRDLTDFIQYAVQGLRDGLLKTLDTIQVSMLEITWSKYIYDQFAERMYTKKGVFQRRRDLALALPWNDPVDSEQAAILTAALSGRYRGLTARTIKRDLTILVEMGLAVEKAGKYEANVTLLQSNIPRRRMADGLSECHANLEAPHQDLDERPGG